jgi:hypothetical protein
MGQSPAGKNVNTEAEDIVGIHHQAMTGEDTADWEDSTCSSELHVIVSCSYELCDSVFNKSNY